MWEFAPVQDGGIMKRIFVSSPLSIAAVTLTAPSVGASVLVTSITATGTVAPRNPTCSVLQKCLRR